MGVVQWLLLLLAIGGVVTVYVVTKRREGPNPWDNMQNPDVDGQGMPEEGVVSEPRPAGSRSDTQFEGMLGADDLPDLPPDEAAADAGANIHQVPELDDDLPDFEVESSRQTPSVDAGPNVDLNPAGLKRSGAPADESQQRIIVLHVASRDSSYFEGAAIHAALRECKLLFGMHEIYHRITEENGVPESVFSVANMLKPGYLNPDEAESLETPGLTMFLVLPGPIDGVMAFRDMMETANQIAQTLGGEVLDDKRALLKRQTAQFLLDEIAEDQRKQRLKQHA